MNRQPHRLPRTGKPALKTPTTTLLPKAESRTSNFDLPALNSVRRTASPSRPYGRYAVGLRPSPDPDAYFDAPSQDQEARRTNQNNTQVGIDRPLSFRNDLPGNHGRPQTAGHIEDRADCDNTAAGWGITDLGPLSGPTR